MRRSTKADAIASARDHQPRPAGRGEPRSTKADAIASARDRFEVWRLYADPPAQRRPTRSRRRVSRRSSLAWMSARPLNEGRRDRVGACRPNGRRCRPTRHPLNEGRRDRVGACRKDAPRNAPRCPPLNEGRRDRVGACRESLRGGVPLETVAQRRPTRSRRRVDRFEVWRLYADPPAQRRPTRSRRRVGRGPPGSARCRRRSLNEGRRDRVGACRVGADRLLRREDPLNEGRRDRVGAWSGTGELTGIQLAHAQRRPTRSRRRVLTVTAPTLRGCSALNEGRRDRVGACRSTSTSVSSGQSSRSTKADAIASARVERAARATSKGIAAQRRPTRSRRRVSWRRGRSVLGPRRRSLNEGRRDRVGACPGSSGHPPPCGRPLNEGRRDRVGAWCRTRSTRSTATRAQRRPTRSRRRVVRFVMLRGDQFRRRSTKADAIASARDRAIDELPERLDQRSTKADAIASARAVMVQWGQVGGTRSTKADAIASARGSVHDASYLLPCRRSTKADAIASARGL